MPRGADSECAAHRKPTRGDASRSLDGNLSARHDQLMLKRFQEEEDLHVYFLLDCSRSMGFGKPAKFDLARQVTAALAYIALADLDRIAVVAFASDILADFPLTRDASPKEVAVSYLKQNVYPFRQCARDIKRYELGAGRPATSPEVPAV